jgi:anti-anti-sigma factor
MDEAQAGLLQLAVEETDAGAVVVTAVGEIDISTAKQLEQTLIQALDTAGPGGPLSGVAVLDLSQVSFLDSTGLAALVGARAHAAGLGRAWRLCGLQHSVERVLVITGMSDVFGIYPDLHAAVVESPLP